MLETAKEEMDYYGESGSGIGFGSSSSSSLSSYNEREMCGNIKSPSGGFDALPSNSPLVDPFSASNFDTVDR